MNGTRTHLTVKETAERWGVSQNYVRRVIWDQKLAVTRFGRSIRIPVAEAENFAEERTRRPW